MQAPLVFRAILGLLMDLAIPASLGAFVMAGMRLRSEGGMNFEASGGFLKWLFWGCFLLSLPGSEPLAGQRVEKERNNLLLPERAGRNTPPGSSGLRTTSSAIF